MFWIIFSFIICSIFMAFDAITSGWIVAISLLVSALISVGAGAGLRGSLYFGMGPLIGGLLMAIIFMGVAQWLGTKYSVGLFGNHLSGQMWSFIGFIIGFVFTTRKFAKAE